MFLISYFFWGKVIFLISLVLILASSTLIDKQDQRKYAVAESRQSTEQVLPKPKYYTNKKGSEVIEIGPGNACQIFRGEDAEWIQEVKGDAIKALNYIQFRLMLGKCQLEAFLNNRTPYAPPRPNTQTLTYPSAQNKTVITRQDSSHLGTLLKPVTGSPPIQAVKNDTNDVEPTEGSRLPFIFPGTKWCGAGSSAKHHDDLGLYVETDKCCRAHDLCEDSMEGKECKHGLCNDSEFTRSHCECDEKFRSCLQKGECIDFEFDPGYRSEWQFFPAQPYLTEAVQKFINPALPTMPPSESNHEEEEEEDEDRRSLKITL